MKHIESYIIKLAKWIINISYYYSLCCCFCEILIKFANESISLGRLNIKTPLASNFNLSNSLPLGNCAEISPNATKIAPKISPKI